jgi:hypothetical protein
MKFRSCRSQVQKRLENAGSKVMETKMLDYARGIGYNDSETSYQAHSRALLHQIPLIYELLSLTLQYLKRLYYVTFFRPIASSRHSYAYGAAEVCAREE